MRRNLSLHAAFLATVLVPAIGGCTASPSASRDPVSASPAIQHSPRLSPDGGTSPSSGPVVDFELTGAWVARITNPLRLSAGGPGAEGLVCQSPGAPIQTSFEAGSGTEVVAVQVIDNHVTAGVGTGVVVVSPPQSKFPPPSPGPFGASGTAWSSFQARIDIAADGMSASVNADLAQGTGPIVERITGGWTCRR